MFTSTSVDPGLGAAVGSWVVAPTAGWGGAGGGLLVTCQKTTASTAPVASAPPTKRPRLERPASFGAVALDAKSTLAPVYEVLPFCPPASAFTASDTLDRLPRSARVALPEPEPE